MAVELSDIPLPSMCDGDSGRYSPQLPSELPPLIPPPPPPGSTCSTNEQPKRKRGGRGRGQAQGGISSLSTQIESSVAQQSLLDQHQLWMLQSAWAQQQQQQQQQLYQQQYESYATAAPPGYSPNKIISTTH